jgi:polyphosphate kinase 2 (PPK2 family)
MTEPLTQDADQHAAPQDRVEPEEGRGRDPSRKQRKKQFEKELARLQIELVKLQGWIRHEGLRVVVVFEGRDAAG